MALVAAAGMAAALAPSAQAAFTTAACGGAPVNGRGASFQAGAQTAFSENFHSTAPGACGAGGPTVSYDPAGSGPGRAAFGEGSGVRDPSIRYIAFDEAPTPTQRTQIEQGGAGTNDDGSLHVIPVAIGAVSLIVNFPNGCTIPPALQDKPDANDDAQATQRFLASSSQITPTKVNETWEKAWEGDPSVSTWGQLVPGIGGAGCASKPIKRIVRSSSSGTTFAFKKWLKSVAPSVGWEEPTLANTAWPNDPMPNPVLRPTSGGNGPLAALVNATDGSIGYGDLKTDRDAGFSKNKCTSACPDASTAPSFDRTFWVRVKNGSGVLQDPQKETLGYKDDTVAKGANCDQATISGTPGGADPTLGDWSGVSAVASTNGYAICAPTYMGVWDDASTVYCNAQAEQDKFRTVVDYVKSIITTDGQNKLSGRDYNKLPTTLLGNANTGVNALDWAKTGGSACPPPPGGGGGTPPPPSGGGVATPPPSTPTASMSIASASVAKDATVTISSRVSGAGTLSGAETATVSTKDAKSAAKKKKSKNTTLTVAKVSLRVSRAGTYKLVLKPSKKTKRLLAKRRKLKVAIKVTFSPSGGGKPITRTVTLTLKAQKKKARR